MKQLKNLHIPNNCQYSDDHMWIRKTDGTVTTGISDYGQDQLGEIVYVELPETESVFEKGESYGVAESVKSVSELLMPISGKVVRVNSELEDSPDLVNKSPYEDGWIIEVTPHNPGEIDNLMSADEYVTMLKEKE